MIEFVGTEEFVAGISRWIAEIDQMVLEVYRGYCVAIFHKLVVETPQWSGNAASNWNISVNSIDTSTDETLLRANMPTKSLGFQRSMWRPYGRPVAQKGDPYAMARAARRNEGKLSRIASLSDVVYISNSSKSLSGASYIQALEANPNNFLRPVNRPGQMVARTAADMSLTEFTPAQVQRLAGLRLGDFEVNI